MKKIILIKNNKNDIYQQVYGIIKPSLLLKIIDLGMDKIIEDFNNEINIRTNKLISVKGSWINNKDEETLLDFKSKVSKDISNSFDLSNYYTKAFTTLVENYFPYFLGKIGDEEIDQNINILRKNFIIFLDKIYQLKKKDNILFFR